MIGNAVRVVHIATGEAEKEYENDDEDSAAKSLGKKGGKARAASMMPERHAAIAQKAASKRWGTRER